MAKNTTTKRTPRKQASLEARNDIARVSAALVELFHNPQTPCQLWEAIGEFVCESMNEIGADELQYQEPFLNRMIQLLDDPMWRRREAHKREAQAEGTRLSGRAREEVTTHV
jgi:hypothetical protein